LAWRLENVVERRRPGYSEVGPGLLLKDNTELKLDCFAKRDNSGLLTSYNAYCWQLGRHRGYGTVSYTI